MASLALVCLGLALGLFGLIGLRSAEGIVETQHREGMTAFADAPIDDRTRIRVTRYAAAASLAVGVALVVVGTGVV